MKASYRLNERGPQRVRQLRADPLAEDQSRWVEVNEIGPVDSIGQVLTDRRLAYMLKRFRFGLTIMVYETLYHALRIC